MNNRLKCIEPEKKKKYASKKYSYLVNRNGGLEKCLKTRLWRWRFFLLFPPVVTWPSLRNALTIAVPRSSSLIVVSSPISSLFSSKTLFSFICRPARVSFLARMTAMMGMGMRMRVTRGRSPWVLGGIHPNKWAIRVGFPRSYILDQVSMPASKV